MAKTALVATDLSIGQAVAEALDKTDLPVSVAAWLFLDQYEDWRFVLASRDLDGGAKSYGRVHDALASQGISLEQTPTLLILEMSHPIVRELRRVFGKVMSTEGKRIGNFPVGDRFVEDGILYRVR